MALEFLRKHGSRLLSELVDDEEQLVVPEIVPTAVLACEHLDLPLPWNAVCFVPTRGTLHSAFPPCITKESLLSGLEFLEHWMMPVEWATAVRQELAARGVPPPMPGGATVSCDEVLFPLRSAVHVRVRMIIQKTKRTRVGSDPFHYFHNLFNEAAADGHERDFTRSDVFHTALCCGILPPTYAMELHVARTRNVLEVDPQDADFVSVIVAHTGNLDALKWVHRHGFPVGSEAFRAAAEGGALHMMQWMALNGVLSFSIDDLEYACVAAVITDNLDMLQWALDKYTPPPGPGLDIDVFLLKVAQKRAAPKVLTWLSTLFIDVERVTSMLQVMLTSSPWHDVDLSSSDIEGTVDVWDGINSMTDSVMYLIASCCVQ